MTAANQNDTPQVVESLISIQTLVEWADNYNRGDVEAIARAILRYGYNGVVRVWRDNVGMAAYFLLTINLPSAQFWGGQDAFVQTLAIVPRITIASIIAELVSELIDTEVYHRLMHRVSERHQWARVLGSNAVSLPIDSLIFGAIAFLGTMPLAGIWAIVLGQVVFKAAVTLVSLPMIYFVPSRPIPAVVAYAGD